MAEQTDKPDTPQTAEPTLEPTPEPAPPRRQAWPAIAALILLLVLAALLGGGYYFWQQLQRLQGQQAQLVPVSELESRAGQLAQADVDLQGRLQALGEELKTDDQTIAQLQQQLNDLAQNQQALREQIDVQVQARRGEWIRAEAAYLANLAVHRLRFNDDIDGALAALRLADQLLGRLNGDAIKSRQAVNRAIDRLVALTPPDLDAIAARIEGLVTRVDTLPLDMQVRLQEAREEATLVEVEAPQTWQSRLERAWLRFKDTLGELVVVSRGRVGEPLLAPEERYFLYHNLRLRLEAARLALIDGNEAVYDRSLERAQEWIQRYYAIGEPDVEQALALIQELRQVEIDPELPQLAPILEPVTAY